MSNSTINGIALSGKLADSIDSNKSDENVSSFFLIWSLRDSVSEQKILLNQEYFC